jgi:hypothetical protein
LSLFHAKIMAAFRNMLWGFVTMVSLSLDARSEPIVLQSSENQVTLLELFTSEGCSSCPPAEKWLSSLKTSPALWKQFVPVAFHVDYWDYLGWRDPWASKAFSDRQRAYTQLWRGDSIYTPGFVLNGQEWRAWSRPKDGPPASGRKAGVLRVSSTDWEHWRVSFSPEGQGAGDYEVHAAMLANELISEVKAGENQGRRLNHDFVVTVLATCSLKAQGDKLEGEFEFKPSKKVEAKRLALAVWVTPLRSLQPIQAVGGWLSD